VVHGFVGSLRGGPCDCLRVSLHARVYDGISGKTRRAQSAPRRLTETSRGRDADRLVGGAGAGAVSPGSFGQSAGPPSTPMASHSVSGVAGSSAAAAAAPGGLPSTPSPEVLRRKSRFLGMSFRPRKSKGAVARLAWGGPTSHVPLPGLAPVRVCWADVGAHPLTLAAGMRECGGGGA
jgi:hypothetical protein